VDDIPSAAKLVIASVADNHFALVRLPVRSHVFEGQPAAEEGPACSGSGLVNRTAAARSGVLAPLMCWFREFLVLDRGQLAAHRAIAALPPSYGGLVYDGRAFSDFSRILLGCLKWSCMVGFGCHGRITSFHDAPELLSRRISQITMAIARTAKPAPDGTCFA